MPLRKAVIAVGAGTFYQSAVNNGFTGSESDLLEAIQGTQKVTISATAPQNPEVGDIWIEVQQP